MILGDLNAGCSYVTANGWRVLRLRTDPKFHWLIGDEEDTTVREKTQCAYDRSGQDECTRSSRRGCEAAELLSHVLTSSGLSSTDGRWSPASSQARLEPSISKRTSVSRRTRSTCCKGSFPLPTRMHTIHVCILCGVSGSRGERPFSCRGGPEAQPPLPPPQRAVRRPGAALADQEGLTLVAFLFLI